MSNITSSTPFRATPLSPTSPPTDLAKPARNQHLVGQTPQTPTSPQLMSLSAQNNASNTQPPPTETASHIQPSSSPPSSEPMSTQVSQKTIIMTTNTFPTPASSTYGVISSTAGGEEMELDGSYQKGISPLRDGHAILTEPQAETMDVDHDEHRRTDHDRQGDSMFGNAGRFEDHGEETDNLPPNLVEGKLPNKDTELSQRDIGSAFLLCNSLPDVAYPTSGPDPTEDLIAVYGLGELAKSVARTDPVTGEKINRLRKSYEGKLKDFNLAGKNKPHKVGDDAPGSLTELMMIPEEQWQIQANGKDAGFRSGESHAKFERAMKMDRGTVSNNDYWEDVLGHEKPKPAAVAFEAARKGVFGGGDRQTGLGNGVSGYPSSEASRPRRANRKRRYDDESFEGYGEGFVDDEAVAEGTYSDEDGRPPGKKRRKKESSFTQPPFGERSGSYGVGMYAH